MVAKARPIEQQSKVGLDYHPALKKRRSISHTDRNKRLKNIINAKEEMNLPCRRIQNILCSPPLEGNISASPYMGTVHGDFFPKRRA